MKPHNQAALSVGKAAVLVAALVAGAGLAGAFGDGKTSHDVKDTAPLFQFQKEEERKSPKPAKKHQDGPPPMTCDGDQCWWTDLGRPSE